MQNAIKLSLRPEFLEQRATIIIYKCCRHAKNLEEI